MKIRMKLAKIGHDKMFGIRCDQREGIKYFDEGHFYGLIKDPFEFKNDDGNTLRGGYYHYKKYDKKTVIVFCHGMGGGHQAYMKEIDYLAKAGFLVLSFDYQGTILSDGDALGGCSQALKDMDKCIKLIKDKFENIYVIGHSWGGWVAQGVCQYNPEIKKLVTFAGLNSLQSLIDQYFKWYVSFLKKPMLKLEIDKYGDYALSNCVDTLNNRQDLKALIYHSNDDKILLPKYNFDLVKANVKNENVKCIMNEDRYHAPQYTKEAVKKLMAYYHKLDKADYIDEARQLADSTDWDELCEMNTDVMDEVVEFFKAK